MTPIRNTPECSTTIKTPQKNRKKRLASRLILLLALLQTPLAFTADALEEPPPLRLDTAQNSEQINSARAYPLAGSAGANKQNRSASAKNNYLVNPDITGTHRLSSISQSLDEAISASGKSTHNWGIEIELRGSAVIEDTGNAKRNQSAGGLIKGNIPF